MPKLPHTEYVFSWRREYDNEGDRDREATEEDTQTYRFGIIPGDSIPLPRPVAAQPVEHWVYDSWDMDAQEQGRLIIPHTFRFYPVNGIELYYAFGSSTNTAPSYEQHVIEGIDSGHLPTRTFHYEAKGGSTDVLLDFVGRKTAALVLTCTVGGFLTAEVTTVGARGANGGKNAVYNTSCATASEDAVEYTNAPIFPPTANIDPFMMNENYTCTWDTDAQSALKGLTISVINSLEPVWDNTETVDEDGVAQKRWPLSNWEKGKRLITANWWVEQDDNVALLDLLEALSNKSLDITFVRASGDQILFELDQCQIIDPAPEMPGLKGTSWFNHMIKAETIKATVQDAIDADADPGFYGEDAR